MLLISRPQNVRGTITCPYHSWCYGLNGELRSTPHIGGPKINIHSDINKSKIALYEIKSYIWQDVIFVNISGIAQIFQDTHHKLIRHWLEFDQPLFYRVKYSSIELIVNYNWKLAIENYCESYHLPWINPRLNTCSKLYDH